MEQIGHAIHYRGNASRVEEILHQEFARWLDVHNARSAARGAVEIGERERNAEGACDRDEMDDGVRRSAERHQGGYRVLECVAGHNARGAQIGIDHFYYAAAA